nr:hypothetical protein [Hydrococcus rivularis]
MRRADGDYAQFAIDIDVRIETQLTLKAVGLDLGLQYFIADTSGVTIET